MGFFGKLFGGDKKIPYPTELQPQIEKAVNHLQALTAAHDGTWHIGQAAWSVDQDEGTITFVSPQGIRAVAPVQIVGSYDTAQGTWLWAWSNPSVTAALTEHARQVQAFGQQRGFELLTTPRLTCPEAQCWELAALACLLCEAQGVYRGPAGSARVFFTFGSVTLSRAG
jgi:hypothetical protein